MNSNSRIAATDIVCLRNISINTLHKGDDDGDYYYYYYYYINPTVASNQAKHSNV